MKTKLYILHMLRTITTTLAAGLVCVPLAHARDIEYRSGQGDVEVWVNIGEPTEIQFEGGKVKDGYFSRSAGFGIEKRGSSLIVFGKENINQNGEAILVRLEDGRSYPIRVRRASSDNPRDAQIVISDALGSSSTEEEPAPYRDRNYDYAPPSKVSGLMREMVLAAEFGKATIPGYTVSDRHKGETVVSDGAILAKIDKIFIGPNLWGYVLDTTNMLDQSQKLNAATFRIDGTRAISASTWELAARPLNVEEQIAGKHNAKVYIVTRAR